MDENYLQNVPEEDIMKAKSQPNPFQKKTKQHS